MHLKSTRLLMFCAKLNMTIDQGQSERWADQEKKQRDCGIGTTVVQRLLRGCKTKGLRGSDKGLGQSLKHH